MGNVVNRNTGEVFFSVNTPDFPDPPFLLNPDLSQVIGLPAKYIKVVGDTVLPKTPAEQALADDSEFQAFIAASDGESELFGDGNDGNLIIAVNTSLTQDIYPKLFTVNPGIILDTAGFRIIAKGGVQNFGTIRNNGQNAVGAAAGLGGVGATIGSGGDGAAGGNAAGVNAVSLNVDATPGYGGRGGDGGAGGAGGGGNGAGVRGDNVARVRPRRIATIEAMGDIDNIVAAGLVRFRGGGGGGSGAGNGGANNGGGGGGGGGLIVIVAPFIFNDPAASIQAIGGNGGNAVSGNSGGGGGGGGGVIATITAQFRDRGARNITQGSGGAPTGTGVAGTQGNNGRLINIRVL